MVYLNKQNKKVIFKFNEAKIYIDYEIAVYTN